MENLIISAMTYVELAGTRNYFYADEKCVGFGNCEKVCQSRKVKIVNKKPVWQKDVKCYFCYVCNNLGPEIGFSDKVESLQGVIYG
jgi:MinD superfamily P-loop ATPase